jgi:protoheme IX farnesyltransferase
MSEVSVEKAGIAPLGGDVRDYLALMKPRVMSLVLISAWAGMVAAPGAINPVLAFAALLCIAVGAGAAGALNMWYDSDIDQFMARTAARPIPRGRITPHEALVFGSILSFGSVMCLALMANYAAGALLAITIAFYVFVYTMGLKRRTPQNIVIGGAAGAFPPMVGWVAATGGLSLDPILLFLIIFLWTPPHFWALALTRTRDYARVNVPMLPVTAGPIETRRQILLYSVLYVVATLSPLATGLGGALYGVVAALSGAWFVWLAYDLYRRRDGVEGDHAAKRLFRFSIIQLFAIFGAVLLEHGLGLMLVPSALLS